jgi:hypothetical protein
MTVCDALFVNYYAVHAADESKPTATWYQVKTPAEYAADFDALIGIADAFGGGKPIVLQEVGMPTDPTLGGSNQKQTKFVQFLLNKWDELGIRIRFLSWFALYEYLYDPTLKVKLSDEALENSPIEFVSTQYPYNLPSGPPFYGTVFWGTAHELAGLFLGPWEPPKGSGLISNKDRVYWVTCGLLRADGQPKSIGGLQLPGSPTSAWDALQKGLEKRRRQQ